MCLFLIKFYGEGFIKGRTWGWGGGMTNYSEAFSTEGDRLIVMTDNANNEKDSIVACMHVFFTVFTVVVLSEVCCVGKTLTLVC